MINAILEIFCLLGMKGRSCHRLCDQSWLPAISSVTASLWRYNYTRFCGLYHIFWSHDYHHNGRISCHLSDTSPRVLKTTTSEKSGDLYVVWDAAALKPIYTALQIIFFTLEPFRWPHFCARCPPPVHRYHVCLNSYWVKVFLLFGRRLVLENVFTALFLVTIHWLYRRFWLPLLTLWN